MEEKNVTTKVINNVNGITFTEFQYKGLSIDKDTWENAPFAICCKNITDINMKCIIETLYGILVSVYGKKDVEKYINKDKEFYRTDKWEEIDNFRWKEEEILFIQWGGIYYEDMDSY